MTWSGLEANLDAGCCRSEADHSPNIVSTRSTTTTRSCYAAVSFLPQDAPNKSAFVVK